MMHAEFRISTATLRRNKIQDINQFRQPVITSLLLFLLLSAFPRPATAASTDQGTPPPMVTVVRIADQDFTPITEYVGHVEAIQAVDLRARVEGFLEKVNFNEGNYVKAGEVLYVIEQDPYQAKVDADRARLQEVKAELTRAGQHLKLLQEASPESFPATDLDNAVAAELTAKAQVASAEAALASSELDLAYTILKVPISGRIGRTAYTRGNLALIGPPGPDRAVGSHSSALFDQ